jgi:hypothetical protein
MQDVTGTVCGTCSAQDAVIMLNPFFSDYCGLPKPSETHLRTHLCCPASILAYSALCSDGSVIGTLARARARARVCVCVCLLDVRSNFEASVGFHETWCGHDTGDFDTSEIFISGIVATLSALNIRSWSLIWQKKKKAATVLRWRENFKIFCQWWHWLINCCR